LKNKVSLIFGCHNHQPLGNFDSVIETIYADSYLPFLQTAANHPRVKIVLHYSGSLLEWMDKNHPEFIELLRQMVHNGQVELLSGSFYEAILAVIPERDQVEQVKRLTSFIEEKLDTSPNGMWLAERVWEPKLAKSLSSAGMEFSLVDDFHFKAAGLENEKLWDYFRIEEEGQYFSLFPICENLRYLTPFQEVFKTIEYLGQTAGIRQNPLLVIVDDGEKFGSWPGTKKWVYSEGWLEKFFTALEENSGWIETFHCGETAQRIPPGRLMYLPIGSYFEMGEWSLFPERAVTYKNLTEKLREQNIWDKAKGFFKGGIWRNFLLKYPESNQMHKKMLALSRTVQRLREERNRGPEEQHLLESALTEVLKSQCNDSYWHGVFGGLYLPHLRQEVWRSLIKAEKALDKISHRGKENWLDALVDDIDGDGREEIILKNPWITACFDPSEGGTMIEMDFKPREYNLLNTLARRFEPYHIDIETSDSNEGTDHSLEGVSIHDLDKSEAAKKLQGRFFYDRNRRASFIDRFLDKKTDLTLMENGNYVEIGDFASGAYEFSLEDRKSQAVLTLSRKGKLDGDGEDKVQIVKKIKMMYNRGPIEIAYEVKNISDKPLEILFGVEMNFALLSGQSPDLFLFFPAHGEERIPVSSAGDISETKEIQIFDKITDFSVSFSTDPPASMWWFPVETISQSEKGYDLTYQSTAILPRWDLSIPPNEYWTAALQLKVTTSEFQREEGR